MVSTIAFTFEDTTLDPLLFSLLTKLLSKINLQRVQLTVNNTISILEKPDLRTILTSDGKKVYFNVTQNQLVSRPHDLCDFNIKTLSVEPYISKAQTAVYLIDVSKPPPPLHLLPTTMARHNNTVTITRTTDTAAGQHIPSTGAPLPSSSSKKRRRKLITVAAAVAATATIAAERSKSVLKLMYTLKPIQNATNAVLFNIAGQEAGVDDVPGVMTAPVNWDRTKYYMELFFGNPNLYMVYRQLFDQPTIIHPTVVRALHQCVNQELKVLFIKFPILTHPFAIILFLEALIIFLNEIQ